MIGLGTIINTIAIIIGGIFGWLFGNLIKERHQDSLTIVCGVSTIFIGIAGAMSGMLSIADSSITDGKSMLVVCIGAMAIVGSILIFCVGLNLVFGKKIRVANMLPALIFAVIAAYIPYFAG